LEEIEISGILHDVGKLGISDLILTKPGPLTKDEFKIIKTHPSIGMKILENISLSKEIREGILYHHLRCDLKGYPQDSDISELPRFARIIGAADALDAMTSHRSYKDAMNCAEVIDEFNKHSGKQFCPEVAKVVLDLLENKIIIPLNECS
jgi:HD-GYP domain-containing protein (c-di-GMP phosphodiesterase class II)